MQLSSILFFVCGKAKRGFNFIHSKLRRDNLRAFKCHALMIKIEHIHITNTALGNASLNTFS
ncbi:hypothetical protein CCL07_09150 [Pseudomonas congelans]|nr:hypothetical protein CCL07_09150 [Pseudomonas congelans]